MVNTKGSLDHHPNSLEGRADPATRAKIKRGRQLFAADRASMERWYSSGCTPSFWTVQNNDHIDYDQQRREESQ